MKLKFDSRKTNLRGELMWVVSKITEKEINDDVLFKETLEWATMDYDIAMDIFTHHEAVCELIRNTEWTHKERDRIEFIVSEN